MSKPARAATVATAYIAIYSTELVIRTADPAETEATS